MQRRALAWRREGVSVGFVPTMGALHAGHLALVRRARREVGPRGRVVVSIYVNPTQFGPAEDLTKYPRPLARDLELCRKAGVDVVFTPTDAAMYAGRAEGRYSTYVVEESLTQGMEGASRPTHFRGVTTIVAKLFNLVLPSVAVFGAKDWQQAAVVRRMVADLNFPLRLIVAPTVREADGLAMSSRNAYLTPEQRREATVLHRCIREARALVRRAGAPVPALALEERIRGWVEAVAGAKLDYAEFFEPESLQPVGLVTRGAHLALAVRMGTTRLIDNGRM